MPVIRNPYMTEPSEEETGGFPYLPPDESWWANEMGWPIDASGIGTVFGRDMASQALVDFMRKGWPRFSKAMDELPNIKVGLESDLPTDRGFWRRSSGEVRIGGGAFTDQPEQIKTYIHELLHALYQHKTGVPHPTRDITQRVGTFFRDRLPEPFQSLYRNDPGHAMIEGMSQNIYQKGRVRPDIRWLLEE